MNKRIIIVLQLIFLLIAFVAIVQEDASAAAVAVLCTFFSLVAEFIKDTEE